MDDKQLLELAKEYAGRADDCGRLARAILSRAEQSAAQPVAPVALALHFHEAYERLAPHFGYETRQETKKFDPASPNGRLMTAVASELIAWLYTTPPAQPDTVMAPQWLPIESAPRDGTPILGWCLHEADPYFLDDGKRLTIYGGHTEGLGHVEDGPHVIVWGGAFDDSTWEQPGGWMPDWWFQYGSSFEVTANPTHWMPLPAAPKEKD